ncbi:uncharacterized protein PHALS_03385 [Plasmopara halstedii]|uniref:Uncharacterized protein n=1 Tax=Plasmopara halstedii TaxID=4781 RepID=A0A0P1AZV4_PLAHL|nr:uncharacterized protein PHALS_03385 [Plasmopara halstedii]CEG46704.1 hypothetical protein PHALS_03385 [Plasmopara halstedii]|eukprot:XP_024583073.1 hypothetical protein PHALS_03385 [Plasmopara halstedii]
MSRRVSLRAELLTSCAADSRVSKINQCKLTTALLPRNWSDERISFHPSLHCQLLPPLGI